MTRRNRRRKARRITKKKKESAVAVRGTIKLTFGEGLLIFNGLAGKKL